MNSIIIYKCTENQNCPEKYNKIIKQKNKCIDECTKDDIYKYEYNYACYEYCPPETKENNFTCLDIAIEKETYNNYQTYENDWMN